VKHVVRPIYLTINAKLSIPFTSTSTIRHLSKEAVVTIAHAIYFGKRWLVPIFIDAIGAGFTTPNEVPAKFRSYQVVGFFCLDHGNW
jgi:hypothetical protein